MDAIMHTSLVPYGSHDRCKSIEKTMPFSMIFTLFDGAIWHTPLVPYGTHDRCYMATGTLGVCHYGGTWCPSVAGGGGEFFVSENPAAAPKPPPPPPPPGAQSLEARGASRPSRVACPPAPISRPALARPPRIVVCTWYDIFLVYLDILNVLSISCIC